MFEWNKKALLYFVTALLGIALMMVHAWGQESQKDILTDPHVRKMGNKPPLTNKENPDHQFSLANPPKFSNDKKPPKVPSTPRIVLPQPSPDGESK